jgi:hypothetical protein
LQNLERSHKADLALEGMVDSLIIKSINFMKHIFHLQKYYSLTSSINKKAGELFNNNRSEFSKNVRDCITVSIQNIYANSASSSIKVKD